MPKFWLDPLAVGLVLQLDLSLDLLREGNHVVIEWGLWTRHERDELRRAGRAVGAAVELRYLTAPIDELWRRIVERDLEGRWGARSIRRDELELWAEQYEAPDAEEFAHYDECVEIGPDQGSSELG